MKAIILAAGRGTRMKEYGEHLPKGMLTFAGKPLLQHQIEALQAGGVSEIYVVSGFGREHIKLKDVEYFYNEDYATTNMVESLMCARSVLHGDVLVTYADIIYSVEWVERMMASLARVGVAVDDDWKPYWQLRYGQVDVDLETLTVTPGGFISELGSDTSTAADLKYRYVGMIRFSTEGARELVAAYERLRVARAPWPKSGKPFLQGYMTDLLDEIIRSGVPVEAVTGSRGWLEFDTARDYEVMSAACKAGTLQAFLALE